MSSHPPNSRRVPPSPVPDGGGPSETEILAKLTRRLAEREGEGGAHLDRVGRLAGAIATLLGLPPAYCTLVRDSAPFHDAGKIAVPRAILRKPGPLTAEEREVVERHAEVGRDLLGGRGEPVLDLAASIAATHHERLDGTGYPHHLAGEQIPIAGRIVAVADVYDALTATRVYRPAYGREAAVAFLAGAAGTKFDPDVVAALFRVLGRQPVPGRVVAREDDLAGATVRRPARGHGRTPES